MEQNIRRDVNRYAFLIETECLIKLRSRFRKINSITREDNTSQPKIKCISRQLSHMMCNVPLKENATYGMHANGEKDIDRDLRMMLKDDTGVKKIGLCSYGTFFLTHAPTILENIRH